MSSSSALPVLAGSLDLACLAELRTELLQLMETSTGEVVLDLGGVTEADVGFVQMLLSFQNSLAAKGRSLTALPSEAVSTLFERAGALLPGAA